MVVVVVVWGGGLCGGCVSETGTSHLLMTITRNSDKNLISRQKTSSDKAGVLFFWVFSHLYVKIKVHETISLTPLLPPPKKRIKIKCTMRATYKCMIAVLVTWLLASWAGATCGIDRGA